MKIATCGFLVFKDTCLLSGDLNKSLLKNVAQLLCVPEYLDKRSANTHDVISAVRVQYKPSGSVAHSRSLSGRLADILM